MIIWIEMILLIKYDIWTGICPDTKDMYGLSIHLDMGGGQRLPLP